MTVTLSPDFEALAAAIAARPAGGRSLIALVGAPGSGKSTLAEALEARLDRAAPGSAAILPMDGYHYDDAVLNARGLRLRKGAPETFDVAGLYHMLERLKRNDEAEVAVPVFDRTLEISRAGARMIPQGVRHLIVEGNYLLLDQAPWNRLRPLFDLTIAVTVPEPVLRARLVARWQGYGLPPEEIAAKVEGNDLPNGRFVHESSAAADHVIAN